MSKPMYFGLATSNPRDVSSKVTRRKIRLSKARQDKYPNRWMTWDGLTRYNRYLDGLTEPQQMRLARRLRRDWRRQRALLREDVLAECLLSIADRMARFDWLMFGRPALTSDAFLDSLAKVHTLWQERPPMREITAEEAKELLAKWRETNEKIVEAWDKMEVTLRFHRDIYFPEIT